MKIKKWLKVTSVEDYLNMRVNNDFYNAKRDNEKEISRVFIQNNGVVVIHTKDHKE